MPLSVQRLLDFRSGPDTVEVTARDTILYALGAGFGCDPLDRAQLRYVYEDSLLASPTMACVIGQARPWIHRDPAFGVTRNAVFHGEQGIIMHTPLPARGLLVVRTAVTEVVDKGAGRGALVLSETQLSDSEGRPVATVSSTLLCRADGGCGGATSVRKPTALHEALPERAPDLVCELPTVPQQALLYRLSGDDHALHVDPDFALSAGFDRPILHGNCTFAIAGHAILRTVCNYDPARLRSMSCRFSAPVFPGEPVRTEIWRDGNQLRFRSTAPLRQTVVLSHGSALLQEDTPA